MADVAKPVSEPDGTDKTNRKPVANRMASLLSPFSKKQPKEPKVKDTKIKETKVKPPKAQPKEAKPKKQRVAGPKRSDKQALASALTLRNLTFGITGDGAPSSSYPRPALKQIKADLLNPHIANRVITQLHALPAPSGPTATGKDLTQPVLAPKEGESATSIVYPIHAACLNCTDDVAHDTIFHKLPSGPKAGNKPSETSSPSIPSVAYADIGNLLSTFKDVQAMSLLEAPDFGLGQPISGNGVLSGSVPTAATVSDGVTQITEQLMALGFATSNAVFPNHSGVYPPLDRMSVITYWWGMELVLPEPSMKHLDKMTSISHGILNFLSAVALVNNGVREILPFVRYISQFVEFEWTAIKAQDQGNGVVCASTWVMPAAMVPRPWDFPPSPPATKK